MRNHGRRLFLGVLSAFVLCVVVAAETAAAPDDDERPFTVVLLPDTQYYCDLTVGGTPEMYMSQVKWIRDRRKPDAIRFVIHLGDIVNNDKPEEWKIADEAHAALDGIVPYSVTPGNHDMSNVSTTRDTVLYNKYFGPQRFNTYPWYGGHRGKSNDSNYCFFSGGGQKYMVLSLVWDPSDDVLRWAGDVVKAHPDCRVIVATHEYMRPEKRSAVGERIWNGLVRRHANIFMVVSGHIIGWGHQTSKGDVGNRVHEILTDYQWEPDGLKQPPLGGDGWLNTLRFVPAERKIEFRSYSPWLKKSRDTPRHRYDLKLETFRAKAAVTPRQ